MSANRFTPSRRQFIKTAAAIPPALFIKQSRLLADARTHWSAGKVKHLIPAVSHEQILLKSSFLRPLQQAPVLAVDDRIVQGVKGDDEGYFWSFRANGLTPDRTCRLQLLSAAGELLCDPWQLKTFPHPDALADKCRILAFTCAGGHQDVAYADGTLFFLPLQARQQLLEKGLSFNPDLVIANGDHIYWDQITALNKPKPFADAWRKIFARVGVLDKTRPVSAPENQQVLKRIGDPQIADLYGARLRSTPAFMLTDDHDLFENDEANDQYITLPPTAHNLAAARAVQHLYYPEFLPDRNRPENLPGSSAADRSPSLSEVFGTIRYGQLLEALLYDTKRYVSLDGAAATMVPEPVESWLTARTIDEETAHLLHIPSTPIGWSAGKWGEWYPDVLQKNGALGTDRPKPYWPSGWWEQHQRILQTLASQQSRAPVIINGDLHAFAAAKITRSGGLELEHHPVNTFCVGPLGSAGPGFPSTFRGTPARAPTALELNATLEPLEKNGFTIIDLTPEKMTFRLFAWRPPQPLSEINDLKPIATVEISRTRAASVA